MAPISFFRLETSIRALTGAASLKQPDEADDDVASEAYPRPNRRGLIEAHRFSAQNPAANTIRALTGAASLKPLPAKRERLFA